MWTKKLMLLGSGELGKEVCLSAKRLGCFVIAVDKYENAPAMQVADAFEVVSMLDGEALERIVQKHKPEIILPEVEAIRTEKLNSFERQGITVAPTAEAAHLTMNRDAIRDVAANELGVKTPKFTYASCYNELIVACERIGFPNVIKPVMSSSGKGQSVIHNPDEVQKAWDYAVAGGRGDTHKVIVEEFIAFEYEITLLTVRQKSGQTLFCDPIGHTQESGDYRESWMPAEMNPSHLKTAQGMAKKVTDRLGGAGIFGVEFFVTRDEVYFSELSPRPHDTGMVTMISQDLSEFDLHVRAVLGLPIPEITTYGPSASAVILGDQDLKMPKYSGLAEALSEKHVDLRIFAKPESYKNRRMGVALALGKSLEEARAKATSAAKKVRLS